MFLRFNALPLSVNDKFMTGSWTWFVAIVASHLKRVMESDGFKISKWR